MKRAIHLGIIVWVAAGCGYAGAASNSTQVLVEEAYVVPDADSPGDATVYVVINNRTTTEVVLTGVSSPSADRSILRNGKGEPVANGRITIPIHSELYMTPGGIRVEMSGARMPDNDRFPLVLTLDGSMKATVMARVLSSEAVIPDHHDYVHQRD